MPKFTRVRLDDELRADADGMPVFRKCFENEVLMSFFDDDKCVAFKEWWEDIGSKKFGGWLIAHPEYTWFYLNDD